MNGDDENTLLCLVLVDKHYPLANNYALSLANNHSKFVFSLGDLTSLFALMGCK